MKIRSLFLATACLGLSTGPAFAEGDAAKGEEVFKRCSGCHTVDENKTNKKGPYLRGVVGRPVATAQGFTYSEGMKTFGATGAVWDEATLDKFLSDIPSALVRGTWMLGPPVSKEIERADVIAFLKSKSP